MQVRFPQVSCGAALQSRERRTYGYTLQVRFAHGGSGKPPHMNPRVPTIKSQELEQNHTHSADS